MIKIFVDTLKNPYFDQVIGLQLQFLVNLILVEEKIEDAVKTKEIMDMPALMALVEKIAKRAFMEKKSSEIFREYTQWWREMAASGMPPSRRERDDQDLRRYPEEPILQSNSGFAIAVSGGFNSY